jgi:hypothetical protein
MCVFAKIFYYCAGRGYLHDNCFKLIFVVCSEDIFLQTNYMSVSTVTTVSIQINITAM